MAKFFERWPKYIKTVENHVDGLYIANSRAEFVNLMLNTAERWYEDGDFGEESWYIHGSYEDWFKSQLGGMTVEVYEEHFKVLDSTNNYIRNLKEYADGLKRRYTEESEYLKDLQFLKNLTEGARPAGFANKLYAILTEATYNGKHRFVVGDFDSI